MRNIRMLVLLACVAYVYYLHSGRVIPRSSSFARVPYRVQESLLRDWLEHDNYFVPATHKSIEFYGRWKTIDGLLKQVVGFPGLKIRFTLQNSTSVFLDLGNELDQDEGINQARPDPTVHIERSDSEQTSSLSLLVQVGDKAYSFNQMASGLLALSKSLSSKQPHRVSITLIDESKARSDDRLYLRGFWLKKGGQILRPSELEEGVSRIPQRDDSRSAPTTLGYPLNPRLTLVDVVAPAKILSQRVEGFPAAGGARYDNGYTNLLEQNSLFNVTISRFPIPSGLCLVPRCEPTQGQNDKCTTIKDLYLRSSPVGTILFEAPWSWSAKQVQPSILLLDIGHNDFHNFIDSTGESLNHRALETFTTNFITTYIDFVLTIRRIMWHQDIPGQDTTFSYNSAPSKLNIFILTPIFPPSYNPLLSATIHNALDQVTKQLQQVEGDKNSHLLDTSGWLDDQDFLPTPNPQPNANGHRKLAYFLSLHLCAYLNHPPTHCPFDKPIPYQGNLYVPDQAELSRVIEQRKVERIRTLVFKEA